MSAKFEFVITDTLPRFKFTGEQCLYNSPEYIRLWDEFIHSTFLIVNSEKQEIAASIQFQIEDTTAVSILTAPFGSFSIYSDIDFDTLSGFINYFENHLRSKGISEIIIKHYPLIYAPNYYEKVISTLGLNGYKISLIDINQIINISDQPFESIIHPMEIRNLNKSKKTGIIFTEHPNTEAEMVFYAIESFRKTRKIPLNMELKSLKRLIDMFPHQYKFFSASMGNEMVTATICVMVNDYILYNFLPAHNSNFNMFSPLVFLMEQVYQYASSNKMKYIDLGVSSINNSPQQGLIRFKERLGCKSISKQTFLKEI